MNNVYLSLYSFRFHVRHFYFRLNSHRIVHRAMLLSAAVTSTSSKINAATLNLLLFLFYLFYFFYFFFLICSFDSMVTKFITLWSCILSACVDLNCDHYHDALADCWCNCSIHLYLRQATHRCRCHATLLMLDLTSFSGIHEATTEARTLWNEREIGLQRQQ